MTHLEHTHAKGAAKNLVSVRVVAITDACGRNKERERIFVFSIQEPTLCHFLDLLHALLLVAAHISAFEPKGLETGVVLE